MCVSSWHPCFVKDRGQVEFHHDGSVGDTLTGFRNGRLSSHAVQFKARLLEALETAFASNVTVATWPEYVNRLSRGIVIHLILPIMLIYSSTAVPQLIDPSRALDPPHPHHTPHPYDSGVCGKTPIAGFEIKIAEGPATKLVNHEEPANP